MKLTVGCLVFAAIPITCASVASGQVTGPSVPAPGVVSDDVKARLAVEDTVARRFAEIRKKAGLAPLKRIKDRESLRQAACTWAINGKKILAPWVVQYYTTSDPGSLDPELEKAARKPPRDRSKGTSLAWPVRYSVAAWPAKSPDSPPGTFVILVGLYGSAAAEFFDGYFTDDIYYKNDWKKGVAPECRRVE